VATFSVRQLAASGASSKRSFHADTRCEVVPPKVFSLADFGPMPSAATNQSHRRGTPLPHHSGTLALSALDATAALTKALAAARTAGGGTVWFPRGA